LSSDRFDYYKIIMRQIPRADAIFQQCLDNPNAGCDDDYNFSDLRIEKRRLPSCPFSENVCLPGVELLEILHYNITAYDVGVNLKFQLSMSHRLTCAPVNLDPFLLHGCK